MTGDEDPYDLDRDGDGIGCDTYPDTFSVSGGGGGTDGGDDGGNGGGTGGELPATGATSTALVGVAAASVLVGGIALVAVRRRTT
ncbi:MAG: LPXTG cell wall anchor domain-containing protein [Ilumatobacteraceae bacterium]